jgi:hypothetical protein
LKFLRAISELLRFDRTNWKALALCLFAAAVFWIFNALNKNYSTNLSLPLHLEYDQEKYATAESIPGSIVVNVSGNGWELLRKNLGQKVPLITLPLERPTETHKIPGSALAPQVVSQLGSLQLNFVVMDTLRLKIEPRVSRKVPLLADVSRLTFKKNFGRVSSVVILPDSVLFEGPKSFVESLADSIMIHVNSNRVGSHFRESFEVIIDHSEFITRNPPVAEVLFEVGPIVEVQRSLGMPAPKGSGYEFDPDSVVCTLLIPEKDQERFQSDAAAIAVTFPSLNLKKGDTLRALPLLSGIPDYAILVKVDSIEFRKHE